jgi:hypothetical protein
MPHRIKPRRRSTGTSDTSSRGGTRTRDPGIMSAGSLRAMASVAVTERLTEHDENALIRAGFGTEDGTRQRAVDVDGEACERVPESLPSRMGADRQRAAGSSFGWGETLSRVRPNQRLSGRRRGAKPPASTASPAPSQELGIASDDESCGPSLDTQGRSRTQRAALHVGGAWANEFRSAVADALAEQWPKRALALRECGRGAVQLDCKACAATHLVPFHCGARTCPSCARRGAAAIAERVASRVAVHDIIMESENWDGQEERSGEVGVISR